MNIDQLLNLEENEKLSKLLTDNSNVQNFSQNYLNLYDKINQINTSNRNLNNQFDLFSNYSNFQLNQNSNNLIKTANQLGLNSSLLEGLLMKNSTNSFLNDKNDLMSLSMNLQQAVCDQKNLFNYNFLTDQSNEEQNRTNEFKNNSKNSLDENNYGTYFNQLLNKKLNDNLKLNKDETDNQNLNEMKSFEKQQNLVNAVAACYSNKNITAAAVATAMDIKNQDINFIKNSQEVDFEKSKMRCISDEKNKFFNNTSQLNLSNQNRPSSTNSLNYSISSNETDCDYSSEEMIKKTKDSEVQVTDPNNVSTNKLKSQFTDKNDEEDRIDCKLEKEPNFFTMDLSRINGLNEAIFIEYQDWAQRTYGDSAKTKTVTRKKYERIVKILNGEEPNNVENSKFRFWVKSKGFRLGAVGEENSTMDAVKTDNSKDVLYVPCIKSMNGSGCSQIGNLRNKNNSFIYKKVAVVENFFQIIYSVHVEMEGKAGKHAGQKRTYRAVAEMYAFLPREAVTRFLMSCKDCQKRMHLQINNFQKHPPSPPTSKNKTSNEFKEFLKTNSALEMNNYNEMNSNKKNTKKASNSLKNDINVINTNKKMSKTNDFNFDLPISTAYLKQIDSLAKAGSVLTTNQINSLMCNSLSNLLADNLNDNLNLSLKNISKEIMDDDDQDSSCVYSLEDGLDNELDDNKNYRKDINFSLKDKDFENLNKNDCLAHNLSLKKLNDSSDTSKNDNLKRKLDTFFENQDVLNKKQKNYFLEQSFNLDIKENNLDENCSKIFDTLVFQNLKDNQIRDAFNNSSKKNLKDFKLNDIVNQSKEKKNDQSIQNMSEIKEEDDEDEEDDENPKINDDNVDPDKLKAFNMFVRLFIDENLDRSVPISRQPKEKIQAILDSCKRQFPELQNRARKRIRTYLKSCRRTKKIQNLRKMGQSLDLEFKNVSNENGSPDDYLVLSKETLNQPVYHLNSAIAERILANAFENEILNARRIKEGLSPLSVNVENETTINTSSPIKIYNKNPYQTFNTSLISRLIDIKQDDSFDKNKLKLTNNSLENLKIANNEKNISNLFEKSTKNLFQNKLENLTNNPTIKELLSIEQLITTANPRSISSSLVLETTTKSTCEIEAKVKSNERLLSNLFEYNLNETELVAIKQLITGYRESAAFLLRSAQELEILLLQQQA